jgi:hypothetical protein
MIDALYVLKDQTGDSNKELLYSLRSVAKHISGVRNLVIVSDSIPPFVDPDKVVHVPETDEENEKNQSILRKILTACEDYRVSDPFLFLNDDHFILQDAEAIEIPYYHKVDTRISKANGHNTYSRKLLLTGNALLEAGFRDRHFDVHFPIVYRKNAITQMAQAFPWRRGLGFVVKSLYGNFHNLNGPAVSDCKIHKPIADDVFQRMINGRFCFSTDERAMDSAMIARMEILYPKPSPWEKSPKEQ